MSFQAKFVGRKIFRVVEAEICLFVNTLHIHLRITRSRFVALHMNLHLFASFYHKKKDGVYCRQSNSCAHWLNGITNWLMDMLYPNACNSSLKSDNWPVLESSNSSSGGGNVVLRSLLNISSNMTGDELPFALEELILA